MIITSARAGGGAYVGLDIEPELASEEAQIEALISKLSELGVTERSVYLVGTFPRERRAIRIWLNAEPPTSGD